MKQRRYELFICQKCQEKQFVRSDRAKHLSVKTYLCARCAQKDQNQKKFDNALGESKKVIKDTHVQGKHRYVLVDCTKCGNEYWARFDVWERGNQKCWPCAHPNQQKHGKTGTALHNRWLGILTRTVHSKEPGKVRVYQDRGITMCEEWRGDFEAFEKWSIANGFKPQLFLDRIDNKKGYSPENCRWVTAKESTANRRKATYA